MRFVRNLFLNKKAWLKKCDTAIDKEIIERMVAFMVKSNFPGGCSICYLANIEYLSHRYILCRKMVHWV